MKFKLSLIAAMVALASLGGCGGGGGADTPSNGAPVASPATLSIKDNTVGTGAEATPGKSLTLHYTGYLYSATAADNKGTQFQTTVGGTPFSMVLGVTNVVSGFSQGVTGMRVGGKRTVLIPASLAYGSSGQGPIPPNAGIVFDLELLEVR
ncbi:FKBP-type peptidyl-prolyl cis-trans isomerase [Massilia sp. PAMC28688]|uniref:FKBP-type peptidyl-prolyl cis-trans isomerase n=1 Tax=Massilia sp. PAMC28688 TaxID=2861283 RepID=UPI001C62C2EF|nr:FKBP-type peptidyl-prolyl cis-trans isomerase [Massilia sp. PAMC28688]QYF95114.1 FKBP-type peptidyl-prolyl cis-trans isomerase [Massilia sp. PAMC28688]